MNYLILALFRPPYSSFIPKIGTLLRDKCCLKPVVADCSQQGPDAAAAAVRPHHILSSCTINYVSKQR